MLKLAMTCQHCNGKMQWLYGGTSGLLWEDLFDGQEILYLEEWWCGQCSYVHIEYVPCLPMGTLRMGFKLS